MPSFPFDQFADEVFWAFFGTNVLMMFFCAALDPKYLSIFCHINCRNIASNPESLMNSLSVLS
jgi:hypothetical protein